MSAAYGILDGKAETVKALPAGAVPTLSAAGSEISNGCTSPIPANGRGMPPTTACSRPRFAVMNPGSGHIRSPACQTTCGTADMTMHTMERRFSLDDGMPPTDNPAEALIRTVMDRQPSGCRTGKSEDRSFSHTKRGRTVIVQPLFHTDPVIFRLVRDTSGSDHSSSGAVISPV